MRARILASAAVVVGGALAALLTRQMLRRRRNRRAASSLDREAPIEAILVYDEAVDLDALGDLTALADETVIAQAEAAGPTATVTSIEELDELANVHPRDAGDLYGVHTPQAVETVHPDDDRAQAHGENWVEALQEDAVEFGPEPESVLVFLDEADLDSPPTDNRDRPVADRGSAGPRGL